MTLSLQKLFVLRHGHDDHDTEELTTRGIEQMRQLAEKIRPHVEGSRIVLFTSLAPRARASAVIIGETLGTIPGCATVLGNRHGYSSPDMGDIFDLMEAHQDRDDVLILVTHKPVIEDLPEYLVIVAEVIDPEAAVDILNKEPSQGEAIHIDFAKQLGEII